MYSMSMVSAPIFSAMTMPSPWAATESVERILSSISGLYFTRISTFEPKPPVASTTALHFTSASSPVTGFFTFTPTTLPALSVTSSVAWVLSMSVMASMVFTRSVSFVVISEPEWVMGMIERLMLWPPNCMRSCFQEMPPS